MLPARLRIKLLAGLPLAATLGCGSLGRVEQGRVIHYDRDRGVVTLILDSNYKEPGQPRYNVLPPVMVKIPAKPGAMGPAPQAGKLLDVDRKRRTLVVFDSTTQRLKTMPCALIEERAGVARHDRRLAGMRFPVVDHARQTITLHLPKERVLLTFSVPPEYLALPAETWMLGDEIRYYFKDPAQALRMMNVTKTEIR
jgi:hypothetical protein